ncbi:MAG TPA: hypothetical protein EYH54_03985 [Nautiliaceae bacterium]|nr:hypothetical protein [Nautiliaceae bacterium]
MEFEILKEEKNKLVLKVKKESHTTLQLIKEYLLKNGSNFVAYYKDHPESNEVIYFIEAENPKEVLKKAKNSIIEDFNKLKEDIEKLEIK